MAVIFENLPSTNTPINDTNLNKMQNDILQALGLDQDTFSTSSTYAVGDLVIHNNTIYECTTAVSTAGAWNDNNWTIVPIIVNE